MPSRAMKKFKSRRGIGSKERAATVEKKRKKVEAGKSWTKAVKSQKKAGGPTLSELIKRRSSAKKGTAEYAAAQNAINKAYGVKKRHKAPKESPKKIAEKALKGKDKTIIDVVKSVEKKQFGGRVPSPSRGARPIPGRGARPTPGQIPGISPVTPGPAQQRPVRSYDEGGEVEASNPYGWPTKDARNGGKK
jgi:hypothetical protein